MIKIEKQLWFTIHKNSSELAYLTYYENNKAFEKRKDTGLRWANAQESNYKSNPEKSTITDNIPVSGFKIIGTVSRYVTDNKLFRVKDPRGFVVEVPVNYVFEIINCTTINNGEISGECVWGFDNGSLVLLPTNSDIYKETLANNTSKTTINKLTIGDVFLDVKNVNEVYAYLGEVEVTSKNYYTHKKYSSSTVDDKSQSMMFTEEKHLFCRLTSINVLEKHNMYGKRFSDSSSSGSKSVIKTDVKIDMSEVKSLIDESIAQFNSEKYYRYNNSTKAEKASAHLNIFKDKRPSEVSFYSYVTHIEPITWKKNMKQFVKDM